MNFRSKELKYNRIILYYCWNLIHNFISKNPANRKGNTSCGPDEKKSGQVFRYTHSRSIPVILPLSPAFFC